MIRLFNRFDFFIFGVKFVLPLFLIFYFFFIVTLKTRFLNCFIRDLNLNLSQIVYVVKLKKVSKILSMICCSIFCIIFLINFRSIFPYTFSFTTQMRIVLFSSICIWFRFLYFSIINNWKNFVSHKIPEGSPLGLSIFLFLIELVREIIRPLTLTLRLVGNMVVGHVLLILLFKLICYMNFIFPLFLVLNTVEVLVCFIQAYIYFTLISMYCREM